MFFVPIPRKIAKERGLRHYFTGNICKRGNINPRAVSDSKCMCIDCKKALAEVKLAHNRTEHGKMLKKKQSQRSYLKNKESILKKNKEYRNSPGNNEKRRASDSKWRKKNPLSILNSTKKFALNNPDKIKAWRKRWNDQNRPKKAEYTSKRRLRIKQAQFQTELTDFVFDQTYELAKEREKLLNIVMHVDHMIPIKAKNVCGLHVWNNFQCLPAIMNQSKKNKLIYTNPHEWILDIPKFFTVVHS